MNSHLPLKHLQLVKNHTQAAFSQKFAEPEEIVEEPSQEDTLREIDPEVLADDRAWWFLCRNCDRHSRVRSKVPSCRHCGFSQNLRGAR